MSLLVVCVNSKTILAFGSNSENAFEQNVCQNLEKTFMIFSSTNTHFSLLFLFVSSRTSNVHNNQYSHNMHYKLK
jgi:hypothetical protein